MSSAKTTGITLRVLGLIILIIDAVLLNMENKDLGTIAVLLIVAICMLIAGHILGYLVSQERTSVGHGGHVVEDG